MSTVGGERGEPLDLGLVVELRRSYGAGVGLHELIPLVRTTACRGREVHLLGVARYFVHAFHLRHADVVSAIAAWDETHDDNALVAELHPLIQSQAAVWSQEME